MTATAHPDPFVVGAFVDDAGHFAMDAPDVFRREIHRFRGREVLVSVREKGRQRSRDQLKYWFGVPIKILSERTGYTKMQMHYLALAICFGVVVDEATGRDVPVVPASKHLTTQQFSELIEWCPPWAFEQWQVQIPLPNEVDLNSLPGVEN